MLNGMSLFFVLLLYHPPNVLFPEASEISAVHAFQEEIAVPVPLSLRKLAKNIWFDSKQKSVLLKTKVVMRRGALEMLLCSKGSKEHESVLAVDSRATLLHAALLLAEAKPGSPVQFVPEYRSATGSEIEISLSWRDRSDKVHKVCAQSWIRNVETGKELEYPWVFAGSEFREGRYLAESGDLICVANFTTAMMDLPVSSSQGNNALLFEAFTERIPPVGTEVIVFLKPETKEKTKKEKEENTAAKICQ
jgi:hypothetical protein|tara:strand:+ start:641 stop:1387 length:747 start_codon:yes stop_codon:yes gene_type:complete